MKLFLINEPLQKISAGECRVKMKKLLIQTFKTFQSGYSHRS